MEDDSYIPVALYEAAIAGDADAIAKLEMRADRLNRFGDTILHIESRDGNTERVRFILREFAHKNLLPKLNIYKHTALHLAAYYGHTEVVEVLIDAATHLPPPSDNDNTHDNPVTFFQAFLRQADEFLNTALHLAAHERHASIVKLLVEADPSDTHIQNDEGKTPIFIAVEKGFNDIAEIISTTCTAPSLDGPHGSTSVVRIKNLDQVKSPGGTLYKIMDKDALYAAAIAGEADALAKLEMEADTLVEYGKTILHTESINGNTEHVRFILREFASKNLLVKLDNRENTALIWAAYHGHTEVVEVLIDAARHLPSSSANNDPVSSFQDFLRHAGKDSGTVLNIAARRGDTAIVKVLVEADPSDTHTQNNEGKTPIYIAVERGYRDIIKVICTTCIAPSLDGPRGSTALHAAIKHPDHDIEVVNLLIGAARHLPPSSDNDNPVTPFQAFLRQCDEELNTALHLAVLNGKVDIVKVLVEADPSDTHTQNNEGKTPIYIAAERGYIDIVKVICTTCTALTNFDGPRGSTALHAAIKHPGHDIEVVNLLIGAARHLPPSDNDNPVTPFQAFLRQCDEELNTALHLAVLNGKVDIVKVLVEAGPSDTHTQNNEGKTPIYIAAERGYIDIVKVICTTCTTLTNFDGPRGSTALHAAIKHPDHDIEVVSLHAAIKHPDHDIEVVNLLIGAARHLPPSDNDNPVTPFQAFLRQCDEELNTALHLAVLNGKVDIVKVLVEAGPSDTHTQNNEGKTPIYIAAKRGYIDIVKVICTTCTALTNFDGPRGSTALHAAIKHPDHDMEVVNLLIGAARHLPPSSDNDNPVTPFQAFLRKCDEELNTALHLAVLNGKVDIVKVLVEADPSDTHTENNEGKTPIYIAAERGYIDIVKVICTTCTALTNFDGPRGSTALHAAIKHPGHDIEVVNLLIGAARHLPPSSDNDNPVTPFQAFLRQCDGELNTALHLAVLNGKVDIVKVLVEADPSDTHTQNNEGKTPIYIAAERGHIDIVKVICTTCTALTNFDGPGGSTNVLYAAIKNLDKVRKEDRGDVVRPIIEAVKRANNHHIYNDEEEMLIELFKDGRPSKKNGLMRLIYKAIDEEKTDIVESLSKTYDGDGHKGAAALILAIKRRDKDSVLSLLEDAKHLATFAEDKGWTPLHYAAYHEFDSILDAIIELQKDSGCQFVYEDKVETPLLVAAEKGYTSTVIRLMELWPASSSAYTAINSDRRNIIHLAAAENKKEMIQGILKYCPEKYKDKILKQQDTNGDTT